MKNKRIIIIIGTIVLVALFILAVVSSLKKQGDNQDKSTYYKDEKTGETYFSDPNQEDEVNTVGVVLHGTAKLSKSISSDHFSFVNTRIESYILERYSDNKIKRAIISNYGEIINESGGFGFNVETEPDIVTFHVSLRISGFDKISIYFDNVGPYVPSTGPIDAH